MTDQQFGRESASRRAVARCLADDDRRRILSLLRGREAPVAVSDLASHLAVRSVDVGGSPRPAAADERRRQRARLHHEHLPAMADAGLVDYDREAGTVVAGDHPAVDDPELDATRADTEIDDDDDRLRALADARRRTALSVLVERRASTPVRTVARDVVARETDAAEGDVPEETVDRAHVSLVHEHLPALADADLVEYDAETGCARAADAPVPRARRDDAPDAREVVCSSPQ